MTSLRGVDGELLRSYLRIRVSGLHLNDGRPHCKRRVDVCHVGTLAECWSVLIASDRDVDLGVALDLHRRSIVRRDAQLHEQAH